MYRAERIRRWGVRPVILPALVREAFTQRLVDIMAAQPTVAVGTMAAGASMAAEAVEAAVTVDAPKLFDVQRDLYR